MNLFRRYIVVFFIACPCILASAQCNRQTDVTSSIATGTEQGGLPSKEEQALQVLKETRAIAVAQKDAVALQTAEAARERSNRKEFEARRREREHEELLQQEKIIREIEAIEELIRHFRKLEIGNKLKWEHYSEIKKDSSKEIQLQRMRSRLVRIQQAISSICELGEISELISNSDNKRAIYNDLGYIKYICFGSINNFDSIERIQSFMISFYPFWMMERVRITWGES